MLGFATHNTEQDKWVKKINGWVDNGHAVMYRNKKGGATAATLRGGSHAKCGKHTHSLHLIYLIIIIIFIILIKCSKYCLKLNKKNM